MNEERHSRPVGVRLAEVDEIEIEIEKLVAGGDGLGRWRGTPIFVPRSAPGDRLRVLITERRPDYGRAEIVEIVEPGPRRRPPPCPYFERCGGCDLQHLEDGYQVELKVEAARETLARLGGIEVSEEVDVVHGAAWGYRHRTQLHTEEGRDRIHVGYFERGTHDLVSVRSCPILAPELESLLPDLPHRLGPDPPHRLDLLAGDSEEITVSPVAGDLPHGEVGISVGEFTYRLDSRCFFQVHRELLEELVERAIGEWTGEDAVDLYAGVGLFSLPLARRYERVEAVEGDSNAARYARKNARRHRIDNVEVTTHAVESWIGDVEEKVDRILVDPPRAGLARPLRRHLRRRPPTRLTYVSCHPATLARDLQALEESLDIESVTFFDLFPQSGHLEAVVQLVGPS